MKPDKRREGSVSTSGLGRNTTEISCEPHVNDSDQAEKYTTQGSSCKVGMNVFESHNTQTEPQVNQGSCEPAANLSSEVQSTSSSCDFSRDPHHVRPDPRSAQGGLEGHGRGAAYRLDQDGAPFPVAGDHWRGPQSLLQEAEPRATVGVSGVASPAEASQDQEGHAPEVCGREAQVDQFGQHDDRPTGDHALRKIYEIAKPHHSDPLGFGKHGSKSYLTVLEEERGYCNWISKTAREDPNGCDPRLLRFSQWLEMCNKEEMIPEDKSVTKIKVPAQAMKPPKKEASAGDPASSSSQSSTTLESKMEAMLNMILEGEVDKMKDEQKPRKKGTKPLVMQTEED